MATGVAFGTRTSAEVDVTVVSCSWQIEVPPSVTAGPCCDGRSSWQLCSAVTLVP